MKEAEFIEINPNLSIPLSELDFRFARSSGPGGQHVNKTETKVLLLFDVVQSPSLPEDVREKLLERLSSRIDKQGILQLSAQNARSQLKNREEAIARFRDLVADALEEQKERRPTRPSRRAKERRLDDKKKQGERKRERNTKWED